MLISDKQFDDDDDDDIKVKPDAQKLQTSPESAIDSIPVLENILTTLTKIQKGNQMMTYIVDGARCRKVQNVTLLMVLPKITK